MSSLNSLILHLSRKREKESRIKIKLGLDVPNYTTEYEIEIHYLTRHMTILGTTGSGKSTTATILAYELAKQGISVLILDRTGEYAKTLPYTINCRVYPVTETIKINLFEPSQEKDIEEEIEEWIDLLDHYTYINWNQNLSPLQTRILRETLTQHYEKTIEPITFSKLTNKLRKLQKEKQKLSGWNESIEALISRIHIFTIGKFKRVFDNKQSNLETKDLLKPGITIIDLSDLEIDKAKNMFSQIICKKLYEQIKRKQITKNLEFVLIVDEAQHLAPKRNDNQLGTLEKYAIELRKYGTGLVTIATRPTLISDNILANTATIICHRMKNAEDMRIALQNMGITKQEQETYLQLIRRLPTGYALVQTWEQPEPQVIKIGLPEHQKVIQLRQNIDNTQKQSKTQTKITIEALKRQILKNKQEIERIAKENNTSKTKLQKLLQEYTPDQFKQKIQQYKGEEILTLGKHVIIRRGKYTYLAKAYAKIWTQKGINLLDLEEQIKQKYNRK